MRKSSGTAISPLTWGLGEASEFMLGDESCISGQIMSVPIPGNSIRRDSDLIRLIRKSTVSSQAAAGDLSFFSDFFYYPGHRGRKSQSRYCNKHEEEKKMAAMSQTIGYFLLRGKLLKRGENKTELLVWEAER